MKKHKIAELQSLRVEVQELKAKAQEDLELLMKTAEERDEYEKACEEEIGNRDRFEEAIAETHRALGGDGEWVGKSPTPPPPDTGDLSVDVPVLAAEVFARAQKRDHLKNLLDHANSKIADMTMRPFPEERLAAAVKVVKAIQAIKGYVLNVVPLPELLVPFEAALEEYDNLGKTVADANRADEGIPRPMEEPS